MTSPLPSEDAEEAVLFFLCLPPGPLPSLDELAVRMQKLDSTLTLKTTGSFESLEDGLINGELTDEEYDIHEPVCWHVSKGDALKVFKKDATALRQIGNKSQLLIFAVEDDCAFEHVFAMIHAILETMDGIFVADLEPGQQIHLNQKQALAFIEDELAADDEEED
jgi:hypothetical protein